MSVGVAQRAVSRFSAGNADLESFVSIRICHLPERINFRTFPNLQLETKKYRHLIQAFKREKFSFANHDLRDKPIITHFCAVKAY
jgi:hypothetical protein